MYTIKLCNPCGGKGETTSRGYRGEYEYETCRHCNGTGRVMEGTYTLNVPFDADSKILNKADSDIINIIRETEKELKPRK